MLNWNKPTEEPRSLDIPSVPDKSFAKRLRWKIESGQIETEKWEITPVMAEEMLKWNDRNRPPKPSRIRGYGEDMKAGRFSYTRVPIIFSTKRLLDGQNRLMACFMTGSSFTADVAFGAPDDAFYDIDIGGARTGGDIFAINQVPNANMAAAATRFVMAYDTGRTSGADAISSASFRPSHRDLYGAYCGFEAMQDSLKVGQHFAGDRLPSPSVAAGCHYVCARKSRRMADEYFEKVYTGIGFSSRRDPAYKVRDYLTRDVEAQLRQSHVACALLLGWNATRTGKPLGKITDDKLPRVI